MNNAFDWNLVQSFLAALEQGSLLRAARALNSSQPTVGRHIAKLESQMGVVLFERTGRGLLPTEMALSLVDSARAMQAGALALAQSVSNSQTQISGTVRITTSAPVACILMPQVLTQMQTVLPDIQIELVSSNAVSNLLRREADIAVRMVQPDQATLIAKRIGQVSLGVWAHPRYLKSQGTPRAPQDLLNHRLVGGDTDEALLRGILAMGFKADKTAIALRTDDYLAQWGAVRAGFGIGFISDYIAKTEPNMVRLLPNLKIPTIPLWLAVHREIRTSPRIRVVYDFLAQAIPKAL